MAGFRPSRLREWKEARVSRKQFVQAVGGAVLLIAAGLLTALEACSVADPRPSPSPIATTAPMPTVPARE